MDHTSLDKLVGSGWSIKRFDTMFVIAHTNKTARGSSYIETPAKFSNPKCGLINIQNHDQKCFQWCLNYYQSNQTKHDHRLTALSKLEDKYDYSDVSFPISLTDI